MARGTPPRGSQKSVRDNLAPYGSCYPNITAASGANAFTFVGSTLFSEPLAFLPANWLMLWLGLDDATLLSRAITAPSSLPRAASPLPWALVFFLAVAARCDLPYRCEEDWRVK